MSKNKSFAFKFSPYSPKIVFNNSHPCHGEACHHLSKIHTILVLLSFQINSIGEGRCSKKRAA